MTKVQADGNRVIPSPSSSPVRRQPDGHDRQRFQDLLRQQSGQGDQQSADVPMWIDGRNWSPVSFTSDEAKEDAKESASKTLENRRERYRVEDRSAPATQMIEISRIASNGDLRCRVIGGEWAGLELQVSMHA